MAARVSFEPLSRNVELTWSLSPWACGSLVARFMIREERARARAIDRESAPGAELRGTHCWLPNEWSAINTDYGEGACIGRAKACLAAIYAQLCQRISRYSADKRLARTLIEEK